ncbi:helicase [Burkholderia ubonensis]|nr:helicase [Burkholderia ubonensis]PAJ94104.1 helicase [Burkholderia ubonensis]PAK09903.1 helicase [Burkholderia ubonensis]RQP79779.1 helicase [Burkholderia ubonensis]RQP89868.1 helicase [Burkholderia ubonensis]
MLALGYHGATAEQLPIISGTRMGIEMIRGAAGSGKTSTALLRLESLAHTFVARRKRLTLTGPVKVLVLTFNRTLAGYVEHLAANQLATFADVSCEINTFAAWANRSLGSPSIIDMDARESMLRRLGAGIKLDSDSLLSEIEYVCGRFRPSERSNYVTLERTGRGNAQAVPRSLRPSILEVIDEFYSELASHRGGGWLDWHLLAEQMLGIASQQYDIVIIDEAQDFSANQLRAVRHHLADPYCLTLVLDTAQRLYPRGYTWAETGLDMQQARYHRLHENHRNTVEIAQFAAGVVDGLTLDDDGTLPDFSAATRHGEKPLVCVGKYGKQLKFAIDWIKKNVDLANETVAFLKPLGGNWFSDIRSALSGNGLGYVEITQNRNWPLGPENIALSTMHSAKGLEFDHVIILGLNAQNTPHGEGADDEELLLLRRLLAMAVGRARKTVVVGYKAIEASDLVQFFTPGTFNLLTL